MVSKELERCAGGSELSLISEDSLRLTEVNRHQPTTEWQDMTRAKGT
jgi:hypothetical protein